MGRSPATGDDHRGPVAESSHPPAEAWVAEQFAAMRLLPVGQIMQAAELLAKTEADARTDRRAHGRQQSAARTYPRIVRAIERAARGGLSHERTHQQGSLQESR